MTYNVFSGMLNLTQSKSEVKYMFFCAGCCCFSLQRNKVFSISKNACLLVASMHRSVGDVDLQLMSGCSIHCALDEYVAVA